MKNTTRTINELGVTIVALPNDYTVDYTIYEIFGENESGETVYQLKDDSIPTDKIELAEIYFKGYVKWDGCSNWDFNHHNGIMIHACSKEELINIGLILAECWEWTKELCPNWMD